MSSKQVLTSLDLSKIKSEEQSSGSNGLSSPPLFSDHEAEASHHPGFSSTLDSREISQYSSGSLSSTSGGVSGASPRSENASPISTPKKLSVTVSISPSLSSASLGSPNCFALNSAPASPESKYVRVIESGGTQSNCVSPSRHELPPLALSSPAVVSPVLHFRQTPLSIDYASHSIFARLASVNLEESKASCDNPILLSKFHSTAEVKQCQVLFNRQLETNKCYRYLFTDGKFFPCCALKSSEHDLPLIVVGEKAVTLNGTFQYVLTKHDLKYEMIIGTGAHFLVGLCKLAVLMAGEIYSTTVDGVTKITDRSGYYYPDERWTEEQLKQLFLQQEQALQTLKFPSNITIERFRAERVNTPVPT